MKIYEQTLDTVSRLIEEGNLKLTKENAQEKIFIHSLSSLDPCIYP